MKKVEDLKPGDKIGPFQVVDEVGPDPMEEVEFKTTTGGHAYFPKPDIQALIDAFGVTPPKPEPVVVKGTARVMATKRACFVNELPLEFLGKSVTVVRDDAIIGRGKLSGTGPFNADGMPLDDFVRMFPTGLTMYLIDEEPS